MVFIRLLCTLTWDTFLTFSRTPNYVCITLDSGILMMVPQVILMMFSLNMVDYSYVIPLGTLT